MLYLNIMETDEFVELVAQALDELPESFQQLLANVQVVVAEWPTRRQMASVRVRHRSGLLGLYEGVPQTRRGAHYGQVLPDKITLFQRPIEQHSATDDEVRQQVIDTLVHEIGHHFGIGEARMAELERERRKRRRAALRESPP